MELEFDKEIDALLRRAERASPVLSDSHLDADELAAFAENALPSSTRQMYVMHLADCDRCRKMLSGFVATAPEKAAAAAAFAAAPEAAIKATLPWYQRIFKVPNLAYGMAGLVVLFGGVIGLLVYQKQMADRNSDVSQVSASQPAAAPQISTDSREQIPTANSSANTNAMTSTSSPIGNVATGGVEIGSSNSSIASAPADEKKMTLDGVSVNEPTVAAAKPAAQPATTGSTAESVDVTSADKARREDEKNKDDLAKTENKVLKEEEQRNRSADSLNQMRDMSPNTASAKRAEGPRQVQSQTNQRQIENLPAAGRNTASLLSSIRTAGGKKFELRDGIWYDTSYTGQGKKDVKRGTEKYIRLDAGLRNIADQIDGTVVIVWNGQAYRIK
jgi:hypothetical protein